MAWLLEWGAHPSPAAGSCPPNPRWVKTPGSSRCDFVQAILCLMEGPTVEGQHLTPPSPGTHSPGSLSSSHGVEAIWATSSWTPLAAQHPSRSPGRAEADTRWAMTEEKYLTSLPSSPHTPFINKTVQASPPCSSPHSQCREPGEKLQDEALPHPPQRQGTALASGEEGGTSRTSFLLQKVRADKGQSPTPGQEASSESQRPSLTQIFLFGVHTFPVQSTASGVLCPAGDGSQVPGRDPGHDLTQVLHLTWGSRAQAGKGQAQHTFGAFSFHGQGFRSFPEVTLRSPSTLDHPGSSPDLRGPGRPLPGRTLLGTRQEKKR